MIDFRYHLVSIAAILLAWLEFVLTRARNEPTSPARERVEQVSDN